jgi:hypothetical protein
MPSIFRNFSLRIKINNKALALLKLSSESILVQTLFINSAFSRPRSSKRCGDSKKEEVILQCFGSSDTARPN